jgi:hypothetical protein
MLTDGAENRQTRMDADTHTLSDLHHRFMKNSLKRL